MEGREFECLSGCPRLSAPSICADEAELRGKPNSRGVCGWEKEQEVEGHFSYEEGTSSWQTKTFKFLTLENENKICSPDFFPRF